MPLPPPPCPGTTARVYVELSGSLGSTGALHLDNNPANFQRGRVDTFHVSGQQHGPLGCCASLSRYFIDVFRTHSIRTIMIA